MILLLKNIFFVGCGGFLGASSRYLLGFFLYEILKITEFPIGTLTVNVLGSFLIGFFMTFYEQNLLNNPNLVLFLGVYPN